MNYSCLDTSGSIIIEETNSPIQWQPNEEMEYKYLKILGNNVLEEQTRDYRLDTNGQNISLTRLIYSWNKDNITYNVDISGYDRTETVKIIESMMK